MASATVTVGEDGRLEIPSEVLRELGAGPGDSLEIRRDRREEKNLPRLNMEGLDAMRGKGNFVLPPGRELVEYLRELRGWGPDEIGG